MSGVVIRPYQEADWASCWQLLHSVFVDGGTYPYPANTTEDEAKRIWLADKEAVFTAMSESGEFLGTYYLKTNQPGRGRHVCNCGYITTSAARGKGVATAMCTHSQAFALEAGFTAMQFNFVVSTNAGAVRLWQKLGFDIVGTLPRAFNHPREGLVDAHVMFKTLAQPASMQG